MKAQTHKIGDNVEKFCSVCNEQLGHAVTSLTKTGLVSRIACSKCGLLGTYNKSTILSTKVHGLATKTGEAYNQARTYRLGQIMSHPSFGTGEVMEVFGTKTIDVLFTDRVRRLIHAR